MITRSATMLLLSLAALAALSGCAPAHDPGTLSVGFIDTGIDVDAAPFEGVSINQDLTPMTATSHGTAVAAAFISTFGGEVSELSLSSYPSVTSSGGATMESLSAGIDAAVLDGADVLVIALTASDTSPELEAAVREAHEAGVIMFAAAGNTAGQRAGYPARLDEVVSVGATDFEDLPLPTSAAHDIDVWAIGSAEGIEIPGGGGTSIAVAAHAAEEVRTMLR